MATNSVMIAKEVSRFIDRDPLDLVERNLVTRAVIELGGARAFVRRHGLCVFERAAGLEVGGGCGSRSSLSCRARRAALNHPPGVDAIHRGAVSPPLRPAAERKRGVFFPPGCRPHRCKRPDRPPDCGAPAFRGACRLSRAGGPTSACPEGSSPRPAWRQRRQPWRGHRSLRRSAPGHAGRRVSNLSC